VQRYDLAEVLEGTQRTFASVAGDDNRIDLIRDRDLLHGSDVGMEI
jgi:hypothetical protein